MQHDDTTAPTRDWHSIILAAGFLFVLLGVGVAIAIQPVTEDQYHRLRLFMVPWGLCVGVAAGALFVAIHGRHSS